MKPMGDVQSPAAITREGLEAMLSQPDNVAACVQYFKQASAENRRSLAPVALAWYRAVHAAWLRDDHKPKVNLPPDVRPHQLIDGVAVAVFATATAAELRRLPRFNQFDWPLSLDVLFEVLADRRPDWLDEWTETAVEQRPDCWSLVRRLARAGLCRRSDSDAYIVGMLAGLDNPLENRTIRDNLLDDAELLDHEIWRLFEVQRGNGMNFASRDEFRKSPVRYRDEVDIPDGWLETFVEFAREGRLSRDRLLDASLAAIEREFPDAQSRWFPKLHEALAPTLDERVSFRDRYLGLLGNRNGSTRAFALEAVKQLDNKKLLPVESLLEQIRPVLLDRTKSRVKQALKLLERAAARHPALALAIAHAAVTALIHESAEVQQAAWRLCERLAAVPDEAFISGVEAVSDGLAATTQVRVRRWLQEQAGHVNKPDVESNLETRTAEPDWNELVQTARQLPDDLQRAAGIPDVIGAVTEGRLDFAPVRLEAWDFPRLLVEVPPIASLDELIDEVAAAFERGLELPESIERLLDGISRLCADRPDDFAMRTGPLRARLLDTLEKAQMLPFSGWGILIDLTALTWAWLTGEIVQVRELRDGYFVECAAGGRTWRACTIFEQEPLLAGLAGRVKAIAQCAARCDARPLLSAPTHRGGWIDPVRLAERHRQLVALGKSAPVFDQALALLRLAPEHREAAVLQLTGCTDEFADALRYACGEPVTIGPSAALWAAAARARSPWSDDLQVAGRHPDFGPDAGHAGVFDIKYHAAREHHGKIVIHHRPSAPHFDDSDFPAKLLHEGMSRLWLYGDGPLLVHWAFSVWPARSDPLLACGLRHLLKNIDWETSLKGNRSYLEHLLDSDVPMTELARLVLAVGLAAKEPGEAGTAVDAAMAAIADGRLCGAGLGTVLQSLYSTGQIKASRWVKSLERVARASEWHAEVLRSALAVLLSDPTVADLRKLGGLVELFFELTVQCQAPVPEPPRNWLMKGAGSGKAARAGKNLLSFAAVPKSDRLAVLGQAALAGRITRARRWLEASASGDKHPGTTVRKGGA